VNKQPENLRVESLTVFGEYLYASSYDCGNVFRYDGERWTDLGRLGDNTQTYSFAIYQGSLHVGTWPSGRVYRFEKPNEWTDLGRLGQELEVMGMVVHNGKLLAGTLPLAEVYEYSNNKTWKKITRLDHTPDVKYRRAWTMAEHDGRLFCSTLPSGKIFSFESGRNVIWGHSLSKGWHHVAAIKAGDKLKFYLDGSKVSESALFDARDFQLANDGVIKIGAGASENFLGKMSDFRIYNQTLDVEFVKKLASMKPPS
jgi:Concanavalin A-like lectin/glucanases superfamily